MAARKALLVKVIGGRDLAAKDKSGKSDPYCFVEVVEKGENLPYTRVRTKTILKNLNPLWNEQFEFAAVDINQSELFVELWDHDRVGSDDYMGHLLVPLAPLLERKDMRILDWFELSTRKNSKGKLCKVSGALRLQLVVHENTRTFGAKAATGNETDAVAVMAPRSADLQYSDSIPSDVLESLSKVELRRQQVIFELINTESAYLSDLVLVQNHFIREAEETKIITADELSSIISNMTQVITLSKLLLHSMERIQQQGPVVKKIAGVFIEHEAELQHLIFYCSHQSLITEKLEAIYARNPTFLTFVQSLQATPEFRQLPLDSYLVKPLQRMCKYPLLLRELLSKTPEDHEDREDLDRATEVIRTLVSEANEQTRHVELCHKMAKLAGMLAGTKYEQVFQNNKLELDTEVQLLQESKSQVAFAILLANTLLIGKGRKGVSLQILLAYNLCGLTISKIGGPTLAFDDGIDKFFLEFSSSDVKEEWASKIEQLQDVLFAQRQASKAELSAGDGAVGQEEAGSADEEKKQLQAHLKFARAQTEELVRQLQRVSSWQLEKALGTSKPLSDVQAALVPPKRCLILVCGESYTGKTTLTNALATKLTLMERNCAIVPLGSFDSRMQCHLRGNKEALTSGAIRLATKVIAGLCENDKGKDCLHVVLVDGNITSRETADVYRRKAEWLGMTPVFACCVAPCIDLEERKRELGGAAPIVSRAFIPEGAVVVDTAEPVRNCVAVVFDAIRFAMAAPTKP